MTDNAIDYAAIRARLEAATPGPWETRTGGGMTTTSASIHSGHRSILVERDGYHFGYADLADAELIAHSRTDLEQLLDRVEELDAILAAVLDLHQPRPNSTSALWPKPLCTCEVEYPCATVTALAAVPAAGEEKP